MAFAERKNKYSVYSTKYLDFVRSLLVSVLSIKIYVLFVAFAESTINTKYKVGST